MAFIARQLQIPIKLIDCRRFFRQKVVDYFTSAYLQGLTPNPCLVCNPSVKFGYLLQEARNAAADFLATGHYALISKDNNGKYHLIKGADPLKEQSYFLAFLTQQQLATAYFPLGGLKKSEVQAFATSQGLQALSTGESQDICFIHEGHYADFIQRQTGTKPQPGRIETTEGRVIGEHQGLHRFTIGQRRGLNCPAAEPYYVLRIDIKRNKLIVGFKKDTCMAECRIKNINWIDLSPHASLDIHVRIRYGQKAVPATLVPLSDDKALIRFKTPQASITPGQGAVFYRHNEVMGAGWIAAGQTADKP
jgi:tRNA-specific 2-thiouridylase